MFEDIDESESDGGDAFWNTDVFFTHRGRFEFTIIKPMFAVHNEVDLKVTIHSTNPTGMSYSCHFVIPEHCLVVYNEEAPTAV